MSFRIRDFMNFMAACDSKTLTDAARHQGISQPAISESLKRLESDFGVKLFYRSRTGSKLTPGGLGLRKKIKVILDQFETLSQENVIQEITLVCHPSIAIY